jgi:hypothetical protein
VNRQRQAAEAREILKRAESEAELAEPPEEPAPWVRAVGS